MIVNKVEIAKFLRTQKIPAGEAIFAAVILGDKGIGAHRVADAFDVAIPIGPDFNVVADALEEARERVAARKAGKLVSV